MLQCHRIFSMGLLKLKSLRNYYERWRFLCKQISLLEEEELKNLYNSDLDYESEDEEINIYSNYINKYTGKAKTISFFLERIYGISGTLYMVAPFLEYLARVVLSKEHLAHPHILQGWAFFDNMGTYGYLVSLLCEWIGSSMAILAHIVFDVTAIGMMIFVCGQYSLLRNYCLRIGGKGRLCIFSKKRDDRARFRISHCHRINIILIKFLCELDKLLKNIKGIYLFLATFTFGCFAVRMNSGDLTTMQLVPLLQNLCGTLTQLFLYCHYGDAVLNESAVGMGEGPFAAAYWSLSPHVRRDLNILGISMMTPRHLRAGPFSFLDLPSFIMVIRTAYSYSAVLGQTN